MLAQLSSAFTRIIRVLALSMGALSALSILAMMIVTCADVVLRLFGISIAGAFDIVRLAGTLTIACALPYTTAVKGHVAIEFFFQKLSRRWRVVVDTIVRLLNMALFTILAWRSAAYGTSLYAAGEVTPTLQVPMFWVPFVIAFSCACVVLVTCHNLLHPGKETIKP